MEGTESLTARSLPGAPLLRVCRDADGAPGVLIQTIDAEDQSQSFFPVELRHLSFRPRAMCRVEAETGEVVEGQFAVVRCRGAARSLHALFLRILGSWLATLSERPTLSEVAGAVDRLVELFRAIGNPARITIQGLWGELFLIVSSRCPADLVRSWHVDPRDAHDFVHGQTLLEVKTATGTRIHSFALEQLCPPAGSHLFVASMLVTEDSRGPTIGDLAGRLQARLEGHPAELVFRVEEVVARSLGRDWEEAHELRFDEALALSSLRFFDGMAIPKVDPNLPAEVSDVKFRVDLAGMEPLPARAIEDTRSLAASALPT
ncbi:MAG: PD-(D/E)XK motif protein [Planctomycetes bacterium]|nr:PD-(D/E)XK motif protein [Planctomycetota bacterium]